MQFNSDVEFEEIPKPKSRSNKRSRLDRALPKAAATSPPSRGKKRSAADYLANFSPSKRSKSTTDAASGGHGPPKSPYGGFKIREEEPEIESDLESQQEPESEPESCEEEQGVVSYDAMCPMEVHVILHDCAKLVPQNVQKDNPQLPQSMQAVDKVRDFYNLAVQE